MSETTRALRIRARGSARDADVMQFLLDRPVLSEGERTWEAPDAAPLARALFEVPGVREVHAAEAVISVRKAPEAEWPALKPAIAAAIRAAMAAPGGPLGAAAEDADKDPDARLQAAVARLLATRVNPAIAAHGGRIALERVEGGKVFLRMEGGCQGCAASAATLREGVERMLRAAHPEISEIVDVTDHSAGRNPFYAESRAAGSPASPLFNRPLPEGVIGWENGRLMLDPAYLAPRLGLTPQAMEEGLASGAVRGVAQVGEGEDAGKTRVILQSAGRAFAAEIDASGQAREIPPPRELPAGAGAGPGPEALAARVRAYLERLAPGAETVSYGDLARALDLAPPGSMRQLREALAQTMREDAAAGRPFIAARVVSRTGEGRPRPWFYEEAQALGRGPAPGQDPAQFHAEELRRLQEQPA